MVNYSGAPRPDLWEILIRQGETRGFEQPRDSETGLDRITIVHDFYPIQGRDNATEWTHHRLFPRCLNIFTHGGYSFIPRLLVKFRFVG